MLDRQQTVANVVLDHSECAEVFQRNRIDFCCKGHMSIEAAAGSRGLDVDALVGELTHAIEERRGPRADDPRALSTPALIEHIVSKHHAYLRRALPFAQTLATKVGRVHGDKNPKLRDLKVAVDELSASLLPHLDEEERELFPALLGEGAGSVGVAEQLAAMMKEHLEVADLLERIHAATDEFTLPAWACSSYRTLFSELRELEGDVLVHVHLENHVLKPRFDDAA